MKATRIVRCALVCGCIAAASVSGWGTAVAAEHDDEIAFLLTTVANSGCDFIRNGSEHSAQNAREHMELKYGRTKARVETTEQFIEYAATRSSMSGNVYVIRCDGVETPTADWLRDALQRYRAAPATPEPPTL